MMRSGFRLPLFLSLALVLPGCLLLAWHLLGWLPPAEWPMAAFAPDGANVAQMIVHVLVLPRAAIALMAGMALGLAGVAMQHILRNALAEPTTLGSAAGAHLALVLLAVLAPALAEAWRPGAAFLGAALATGLAVLIAARDGFSRITLILAGMLVSLFCAALAAGVTLFHDKVLQGVFLWGAGALDQIGWGKAGLLAILLVPCGAALALMVRPMTLAGLEDDSARALGVPVRALRLGALFIAVLLSSATVAAVGIIGFVGLAAPALARLSGARRLGQQLVWAPILGAGLLLVTDQLMVLISSGTGLALPAGVATTLLGGPVLIALLPRLRRGVQDLDDDAPARSLSKRRTIPILSGLLLLTGLVFVCALMVSDGPDGFVLSLGTDLQALLPWRLPWTMAALAAGALMAAAGAMLQRLTGNPMASPEVLGIASGAGMGVVALGLMFTAPTKAAQIVAAGTGAFLAFLAVLAVARRAAFHGTGLLLAGIAIGTMFSACLTFVMTAGDPRLQALLAWLAGSTYRVTAGDAAWISALAALCLPCCFLAARWLDILPLGQEPAAALGLALRRSRMLLLLLSSLMVGAATLVVGPLSFVGLLAPHAARSLGCRRAASHLGGSAVLGATIMVAADWLGRVLLFPWQIPAGLLAAPLGGGYFLWLLLRRAR